MRKDQQRCGNVTYRFIGVIHSPFVQRHGMPIQAAFAEGAPGTVELEPEYVPGLQDLEGFSHILLVYHFHLSRGYALQVKPFLEGSMHGVFATRAPRRPNAIGISVVRLERVEGNVLHVTGVDVVDGTPLLDIKPYVPGFDDRSEARIGWLEGRIDAARARNADERFVEPDEGSELDKEA
jgi:tRNA-Thr(GGU) m(6)t(6)A37 methyltransferase TsaA